MHVMTILLTCLNVAKYILPRTYITWGYRCNEVLIPCPSDNEAETSQQFNARISKLIYRSIALTT